MVTLLLAVSVFPSITGVAMESAFEAERACSNSAGCTQATAFIQHQGVVVQTGGMFNDESTIDTCDESVWPDKDHGLVCSDCKVLVNHFSSVYHTCDNYCAKLGRLCKGAWEEQNDNCDEKHRLACDESIDSSDAICECSADATHDPDRELSCYEEMPTLVADEGGQVGQTILTASPDECKASCNENEQCNSFSLCPQWHKCWMKDRVLVAGEATKDVGACKTYFKQKCGSITQPSTFTPTLHTNMGNTIKVVSYNLYWWNAFGQNPSKGHQVTNNIKNKLQPDVMGLQECDNPDLIKERTGYLSASDFAGAQGIVVKPGLFTIGQKGHRDIQATGKWGPRFVTWVQLTHPSGRKFWHFNTHWCVHSGNGQTCSADKRFVGAQNMLSVIREKAMDEPVIITGDFNAGMGEPGPQHFLQNGFSMIANEWVDAIFVSEGHWKTAWTGKGNQDGSDHAPIIAELEF